jgi:hypothetical protein
MPIMGLTPVQMPENRIAVELTHTQIDDRVGSPWPHPWSLYVRRSSSMF